MRVRSELADWRGCGVGEAAGTGLTRRYIQEYVPSIRAAPPGSDVGDPLRKRTTAPVIRAAAVRNRREKQTDVRKLAGVAPLKSLKQPAPGCSVTLDSMLSNTYPSIGHKEQVMRIGSSIFLIALGAILAWAIAPGLIPNVDQTMIGYILMVVGVIGLIASLVLASPGRSRTRRVSETRSVVDPNTGETITRNESRDAGI